MKGHVRLLESCRIGKRTVDAGSVVEVSRETAQRLLRQGLAVPHPGPGKRFHETQGQPVPMTLREI